MNDNQFEANSLPRSIKPLMSVSEYAEICGISYRKAKQLLDADPNNYVSGASGTKMVPARVVLSYLGTNSKDFIDGQIKR